MNKNHGPDGRFASGPSGGSNVRKVGNQGRRTPLDRTPDGASTECGLLPGGTVNHRDGRGDGPWNSKKANGTPYTCVDGPGGPHWVRGYRKSPGPK